MGSQAPSGEPRVQEGALNVKMFKEDYTILFQSWRGKPSKRLGVLVLGDEFVTPPRIPVRRPLPPPAESGASWGVQPLPQSTAQTPGVPREAGGTGRRLPPPPC